MDTVDLCECCTLVIANGECNHGSECVELVSDALRHSDGMYVPFYDEGPTFDSTECDLCETRDAGNRWQAEFVV